MTEKQIPNHHTIGVEVNKAVVASVHNKAGDREAAIKNLAQPLANGGTPAIEIFSQIQKGK